MCGRIVFFLFCALTAQNLTAGNLNLKLSAEGGAHRFEKQSNSPLLRFSGALGFKQNFGSRFIRLQARLTPEVVGLYGNASSMKFSATVSGGARYANGGWESRLRAKNYYYQLSAGNDVYFATAIFGLSGFYRKRGSVFYFGRLNYAYRDLDTAPANRLDALQSAAGLLWKRWTKARVQVLFNLERFRVSARQQSRVNNGWRIGPEINFHYQANIFIRSTLRFLYQYSDVIRKPGNEIQAQFIFGKFLNPRLSLFAFLDYRLVRRPRTDVPPELLYSSIDNENWYYLKLEYEALKRLAVYAKAGYFRDVLSQSEGALSGMQALIGVSWKTP